MFGLSTKYQRLHTHINVCKKFASRQRERRMNYANKFQNMNENLPEFPTLIKSFYIKAHPDILRSYNETYSVQNDLSFQQLNEVLSAIKVSGQYPPQLYKELVFHYKDKTGNITQASLRIRTAGGDCRKALNKCFQAFFQEVGIHSGKFAWGKDYFPDTTVEGLKDMKEYDDVA